MARRQSSRVRSAGRVVGEPEGLGDAPALRDSGGPSLREPLGDFRDLPLAAAALGDLEAFGPEGVSDPLRLVPEVVRREGRQKRLLPRTDQEEVTGSFQGTEMEKVGVRTVGSGLVVPEIEVLRAGGQDQRRVAGLPEVLGDSLEADFEMLAKRVGKIVGHGARRIRRRCPWVMP